MSGLKNSKKPICCVFCKWSLLQVVRTFGENSELFPSGVKWNFLARRIQPLVFISVFAYFAAIFPGNGPADRQLLFSLDEQIVMRGSCV